MRDRFKTEGMLNNLFKNIVFLEFSGSILESKSAFGVRLVNGTTFLQEMTKNNT